MFDERAFARPSDGAPEADGAAPADTAPADTARGSGGLAWRPAGLSSATDSARTWTLAVEQTHAALSPARAAALASL